MTIRVSKSQFKARALEFFREIEAGEESIVITANGKPTIEIRPYRPRTGDPRNALRGSVLRYLDPTMPVGEEDWDASR